MLLTAESIHGFACRVKGDGHETIINSTSAGRAKAEFHSRVAECGIAYMDIRVRKCGGPTTTPGIERVGKYRGVPFARAGMRVKVGDDFGWIVGHNDSANWDVMFETGENAGLVLNCHPNWMMTYYGDGGEVLATFDK